LKRIRIIAPIGSLPSRDKDLERRLKRLPKNASLSRIYSEIGKWEKEAVRKEVQNERTAKSGIIDGEWCRKRLQGAQLCSLFIF
jgi:hypothetical protein